MYVNPTLMPALTLTAVGLSSEDDEAEAALASIFREEEEPKFRERRFTSIQL